ncbi:peptidylprolyl isomerase [Roseivirga pacifica]|uniref:peptidylprolyl isomerase n=1 Tax=Roseivirga pacifica TaxID=1267423 RepID=UPI00227CC906|nr:peptidylprolyl isomerase [Roseivirga pacifica]
MRLSILFALLAFSTAQMFAWQQSNTVATIDNTEITAGELLYAYNKNRDNSLPIHHDSLRTYLDQYINFKLKVLEAYDRGLDQNAAFQQELNAYLSQIRKPYLQSNRTEEALVQEAYERMQWEVNASHILLRVNPDATPADTLAACNKLDSLRATITDGKAFAAAAKALSQDGSAKDGGKLGWFSAFMMVYPFETAAYETEAGTTSKICRTEFGYHLVYVNEKRPARGKVRVSHIFLSNQKHGSPTAQRLAQQAYDSLQTGANWNDIVKRYSDDNNTKMKAGALPFVGLRQLPDDFLDIAFSIETEGKYTQPKPTQFGWHIVRLDAKQPLPPLTELRAEIERQIKQSGRNQLSRPKLLAKLKAENQFVRTSNENAILNELADKNLKSINNRTLRSQTFFKLLNKPTTAFDLKQYLLPTDSVWSMPRLQKAYSEFEAATLLQVEDSLAPTKYPEYGYLRQEYEEGLLLFEIMQKEVWDKALEDSLGQVEFYQNNLNSYTAEERYVVTKVNGLSNETHSAVKKALTENPNYEDIETYLAGVIGQSEVAKLKFAKTTITKSEIPNFEAFVAVEGDFLPTNNASEIIQINEIRQAGHFSFEEIRGRVISDYQQALENEWNNKLRSERKIVVNEQKLKALSNLDK